MDSLIVFVGAGASYGVSTSKYPMAVGFKDSLPADITGSRLYESLHRHIEQSLSGGAPGAAPVVDIEHVLWELGKLIEGVLPLVPGNGFLAEFLTSGQLAQLAGSQTNIGPAVVGQLQMLLGAAEQLRHDINAKVYDLYSQSPSPVELMHSWGPVLEWIERLAPKRTDFFTTNYDVVLEEALLARPKLGVGFGHVEGLRPSIDLQAWRSPDAGGMLTKLHGSVDWAFGATSEENGPVIRRGHFDFAGDHKRRSILYPGFKGKPASEPFVTFHKYFERRLAEASHVLAIGFAFRDEYINELFSTRLDPGARVAVVNPGELQGLPFHRQTHLMCNFGGPNPSAKPGKPPIHRLTVDQLDAWVKT